MLNLKEIYKFSKEVQLQFEEIIFLYSIHDRVESPEDEEFKALFRWYTARFEYYNRNGSEPQKIRWSAMVNNLVSEGFLEDLRSPSEIKAGEILVQKLKVTEKFTKLLLMKEGKEYWWDFYYDIWKQHAAEVGDRKNPIPVVLGTSIYILKPDSGNPKMSSIDKIKDIFWDEFCQKGQKSAINSFFGNTETYLIENGANMKICNFFACYNEMFSKKGVK